MRVLITGANGYLGRRLKLKLLTLPNLTVRLFVRSATAVITKHPKLEIHEGDILDKKSVLQATHNIDTAYYLIHLMHSEKNYATQESIAAQHFVDACAANKVKRIIYIGSLGNEDSISPHIASRHKTGQILSSRPQEVQCLWFRAGAIIGSGSASYEIIHHLVQKLPIIIAPKWLNTKTQTININDVLKYLIHAKDLNITGNKMIDIGSNTLNFKEMLKETARIMGLTRYFFPIPVTTRLSAYWLIIFTPVPYSIASALVNGLNYETTLQNNEAQTLFPQIHPLPFTESIQQAFEEVDEHVVFSRWSDSFQSHPHHHEPHEYTHQTILSYTTRKSIHPFKSSEIFDNILHLGGEHGWFSYHFLWKVRGFIDKLFGGYGLSRGRRDKNKLRVGDSLDFWRVIDIKHHERLLLISEMKLPGKGWLEFRIAEGHLILTAYFIPKGLWGRAYWYLFYWAHCLTFEDISKKIIAIR